MLPSSLLENDLLERFPELESIQIKKDFPNTLIAVPISSPIKAQWVYTVNNVQYFAFVSEKNIFLEQGENPPIIIFETDPLDTKIPFYSEFSEGEKIDQIKEAKEFLESVTSRKIERVEYLRNAQEVHFTDSEGIDYWLYLPDNLLDQIEKLQKMIAVENVYATTSEYIDLRIRKKVIYK